MRRLVLLLVALLLAAPLQATWSIILVDRRTGEIAIASATCLAGFDLKNGASVVRVGRGAAAAQSFVDSSGQNRLLIFTQLGAGTDPAQILAQLAASDPGHQTRQYGIVDVQGRAIGFTGNQAGAWAGHLTGSIGDIVYAIQGNVLTGQPVVQAAEQAVRLTAGDLPEKLMAAMEAARAMGGDGRCSCPNGPTACGAPPTTFNYSAYIGYMLVARPGDVDGICNANAGCANGSYFLDLNIANQSGTGPDPVFQLRTAFLNWRLQKVLRPDHFLSSVRLDVPRLQANGLTTTTARIELRDWRNARIPFGGAQITASVVGGGVPLTLGSVVDHGNGTYSLPVTGGTVAGTARVRIVVDDGAGPVQLGPDAEVTVANDGLWADRAAIDVWQGASVNFVWDGGAARAGRFAVLLASASGTTPGVPLAPGVTLPLVPDPLTVLSLDLAASGAPSFAGALDPSGRRQSTLAIPGGVLAPLLGLELAFAWGTLGPIDYASNPVRIALR
ncbi:MAG: hypothetical protein RL148_2917 [Planctomycetota bacterium]